ncbi:MAG: HAMP domain-containing histidine kinase [Ktedonobacteraceae bacterium]|nr:HAMP domain-containing histidine kinase [Ktedonobacteraceae bacterium]
MIQQQEQSNTRQAENEARPSSHQGRRDDPHTLPRWLRSLLSLRWRFTFVYVTLFGVFVVLLSVLISYSAEHTTLSNLLLIIGVISVVTIIVGMATTFVLTGVMLRPLRDMADAARAIALGDFKQRVRLPLGNDEIGELATSFNDMVDQIEQAFEAQRASERRAHRFISSASHELRTPLTSIRGLTEVLMRGAKDNPETTQRVLRLMKNESERMTRLVNDMLTLARIDEGRPFETQRIDLVDIAIEGVEQAKVLVDEGYKVLLDLATEERLMVLGDVDRLKQVLFILFDNAIKHSRPASEGKIILRLDRKDDQALMQVIDNGCGITPEDLPHVFDRFYRGQHVPPYKQEGTPITGAGLGLAIALAIVQAHHGDICVQSEVGTGTTFTVKLPCSG